MRTRIKLQRPVATSEVGTVKAHMCQQQMSKRKKELLKLPTSDILCCYWWDCAKWNKIPVSQYKVYKQQGKDVILI